jgi:hypothetical protein
VPALVCGIYPHSHDRLCRGVAEPLGRRYPSGSWFGCLSVTAPLLNGTPLRGSWSRELRKVRYHRGSLVQIPGTEHNAHPAIELVKVEQSQRVVLAEQDDQPFPVGLSGQRPRTAGRGAGHR